MDSVGVDQDDTLAETAIGLRKNECTRVDSPFRRGPLHTLGDVECVTADYVAWFNQQRLMHRLGRIPPAEAEARYYSGLLTVRLTEPRGRMKPGRSERRLQSCQPGPCQPQKYLRMIHRVVSPCVDSGRGQMNWRTHQVEPWFDQNELDATASCIENGWLTEGPQAAEFLAQIQTRTGAEHAVLAPNGTLGLFLALLAADLPRDSEILIPTFTFYASASAAVFAGLRPVFVDADPQTFNLDIKALEPLVSARTAAIMPVHVYGHSPALDDICAFAARHDLVVIEDAAQAYGVTYRDRHAGTWGDLGVISFFSDKTVTTGEGGVVLTNDTPTYEKLRLLRNQGRQHSGTFVHDSLGMNFRMTDLQCAVGNAQLRKLPQIIARKRENHARYVANLNGVPGLRWLQVQPGSTHVPFRFALVSERKEQLVAALEENGVQSRGFFYPLHLQPALRRYACGPLPVSEELSSTGLCLPVHQALKASRIDEICGIIREVQER